MADLFGSIHLTHAPLSEGADQRVAGEDLAVVRVGHVRHAVSDLLKRGRGFGVDFGCLALERVLFVEPHGFAVERLAHPRA